MPITTTEVSRAAAHAPTPYPANGRINFVPASSFNNQLLSIAEPLANVEELLHQTLQSYYPAVDEMLRHVAGMGGKHLRPALVILAAKTMDEVTDETIRLAAVVELVHLATLVHDDILDNASLRRHRPTVHAHWGTQFSILSGDWLFTQAYHLASCGESTLPGRWIAQAARHVCEGEIRQNATANNVALTEEEYLEIIAAKTGQLCGVSCSIGGWSAGASSEACDALHAFGANLGIAFQIYDDWLDVWGSVQRTGKTLGTDQASRKPTLPLICHWNSTDNASSRLFEIDLRPNDQANRYTLQRARDFMELAVLALERLPASQFRHALEGLARSAINHSV